jgi:hypothetical protein
VESVHIFGVNHFLQPVDPNCLTPSGCADEAEQKAGLRAVLGQIIANNQVGLIAEEEKPGQRNVGAALAAEHHANYIELTMPIVERERRGIRTPGYDRHPDTRAHAYREFERHMFERIVAINATVTLAICGRRHMRGLEQRVIEAGVRASVYDVYDYNWYRGIPQEDGINIIGYEREDEG